MKCISLCCPHGEIFIANPHYDYSDLDSDQSPYICTAVEGDNKPSFTPEVRDIKSNVILDWEEASHYLLIAPRETAEIIEQEQNLPLLCLLSADIP